MHADLAATTSREDFRLLSGREHQVVPSDSWVLADSETPLSATSSP